METFNTIINGDMPVLVDFHAAWCGPCKAMNPIMEEIGEEMEGDARILKIDIDQERAVATKFQVHSVPTFIIFKNGLAVWRNSGKMDKASLLHYIRTFTD